MLTAVDFPTANVFEVMRLEFPVAKRHRAQQQLSTCSVKKMFLEILQNLQENPCARVSFIIM